MEIVEILIVVEIIISVGLIAAITLQPKDSDAGTLFGGGFGDQVKRTKRGFELFLHNTTIVMTVFFAIIAIIIMFLSKVV
jgi:protein translocase SecG subunit